MDYDVIVVGARCAGSPTAMLLARQGVKVLLVDRSVFPSDIVRGNVVKPLGGRLLRQWGLLDRVLATGCPPWSRRGLSFEGISPELPAPPAGAVLPFAPRRTVLDALLVDAAARAGAEVEERVTVTGLVEEDGRVTGIRWTRRGSTGTSRAKLVVGADGKDSLIARFVNAPTYRWVATQTLNYWGYWSGTKGGPILYFGPGFAIGVLPTNDGQNLIWLALPPSSRRAWSNGPLDEYLRHLHSVPEVDARLEGATMEGKLLGVVEVPNYFRQPFGKGWALVGDAGHHKDPMMARGISDAFRDAELLSAAVVTGMEDGPLVSRLRDYWHRRDEASCEMSRLNVRMARLAVRSNATAEQKLSAFLQLADAESRADAMVWPSLAEDPQLAAAGQAS
jgi:flavin-dependent dehydrogenase